MTSPNTKRRRSLTNSGRSTPRLDQKGNLGPLQLQILQWVETCPPGETRPSIEGLAGFTIDAAVAELVLAGLIRAVAVPETQFDRAHWLPTGLTADGWRALLQHRRSQPTAVSHSWWRLRMWG